MIIERLRQHNVPWMTGSSYRRKGLNFPLLILFQYVYTIIFIVQMIYKQNWRTSYVAWTGSELSDPDHVTRLCQCQPAVNLCVHLAVWIQELMKMHGRLELHMNPRLICHLLLDTGLDILLSMVVGSHYMVQCSRASEMGHLFYTSLYITAMDNEWVPF